MSSDLPFAMKIGVCGIACQVCPRMASGKCPNGEADLPSSREPDVPDRHLCFSKGRHSLFPVFGVSL